MTDLVPSLRAVPFHVRKGFPFAFALSLVAWAAIILVAWLIWSLLT